MKILIIDDEVFARNMLKRLLTRADVEIVEADNAYEGFYKFEEEKPDIAICDVMMAGIGGDWMIEKILNKFRDSNVIVCSGMEPSKLLKYKLIGAKAVLHKPIKFNELWHEIDKIMES